MATGVEVRRGQLPTEESDRRFAYQFPARRTSQAAFYKNKTPMTSFAMNNIFGLLKWAVRAEVLKRLVSGLVSLTVDLGL